jgi:hypothetical protein
LFLAEEGPEILSQRAQPNRFDGGGLVVGPIIAASSKGLPNANPISRRVGRPGKALVFHKRFHQSQVMIVNPLPIARKLAHGSGQ